MEPTQDHDVVVVGGGLGGLAAAAFIARTGTSVTVYEHRGRLGGRAVTDERNRFRFNQGPHALYLGGEGMRVLETLGIQPTGVVPASDGARMALGGTTHLAPAGPLSLARTTLLGLRDKIELGRVLRQVDTADPATLGAVTAGDWVATLTDRAIVGQIVHSLIRLASYVDAPGQLSAEIAALQVQRALSTGVLYLDHGWQQLVDRLEDVVRAAGGRIVEGEPVHELPDAPAVILAIGGSVATSRLLGMEFDAGPEASAATLDLSLSRPPNHRFVIGIDEPIYLSDHGVSTGMRPAGTSSVSAAQYLSQDVQPDRERLRAFAGLAGVAPDDVLDERYLHRMTTVSAIATADRGGLAGRPPVALADHPGTFLVGDWVGGTGHLADAVLASAHAAADSALTHLDRRVRVR